MQRSNIIKNAALARDVLKCGSPAPAAWVSPLAASLFLLAGHAWAANSREERPFPAVPSVYVRYAADNPANAIVEALKQNFTAAEVDTGSGVLRLPNLGFSSISYPHGIGPATPVYFSSSGTLPPPLVEDTPYYIVPAPDGGYRAFPLAVDADAATQPGAVPGDKVLPAQNVSQGVNAVVFTGKGAGTHMLSTRPLLRQFTDLGPHGFHSVAVQNADKHTFLEVEKDAAGRPFVRTAGATARENFMGSYNAYGQTMLQAPPEKRMAAREQVAGKRVVYQLYVARVRSFQERQTMRFLTGPAGVAPDSDRVTYAIDPRLVGSVKTGDMVTVRAYPGSELPSPLVPDRDYYARQIDNKTLTLHPSAADAAADSNRVDIMTAGKGSFVFVLPQRVADRRRWSFFTEVLEPGPGGGNTLSARLQEPIAQGGGVLRLATGFTVTGEKNGNIAGLAAVPELSALSLWAPPRAVLPSPLKAGITYWVTRSGSAVRLHESLESARQGLGKPTASSGCVQFTAPGSGEALASYNDGASAIAYGTLNGLVTFNKRVPLGPLAVYVFKIDFDDPAQPNAIATLGINEVVSESQVLKLPRGLTPPAANDKSKAWTLFNSAQGHVPIDMDCYEIVFGSSKEAVPDAQLQAMVDYFKSKYGIKD